MTRHPGVMRMNGMSACVLEERAGGAGAGAGGGVGWVGVAGPGALVPTLCRASCGHSVTRDTPTHRHHSGPVTAPPPPPPPRALAPFLRRAYAPPAVLYSGSSARSGVLKCACAWLGTGDPASQVARQSHPDSFALPHHTFCAVFKVRTDTQSQRWTEDSTHSLTPVFTPL